MKDTDLIAALRNLKATFKPMVCLDCQKGDNCTINGCNLIGLAADTIEKYESSIESIEKMYYNANGVGKSYLRDVLKSFHIYMPPIPDPGLMVYDFEICSTKATMIRCLNCINNNQWTLLSVTYGPNGYTIFFRRPANG